MRWDGRGWSGGSAGVGLERLLASLLGIGLAGGGSTVGFLVVLGGTANWMAGLAEWELSPGNVGFRGGKGWLCRLGLVGLGVRWVCRGAAVL